MKASEHTSIKRHASVRATGGAPERISPLYNDVFLGTFGKSPELAKSFANAVLRSFGLPEVDEVTSLKADAAEPNAVGLRTPRCDVIIVSGEQVIDLEAQRYRVDYAGKALFYASKLLVDNTPEGGDGGYRDLPQVVVIMLIEGDKMFDGPQSMTMGTFRWERGVTFPLASDRMVFVAVELDKVARAYNGGVTEEVLSDELSAWLYVLARGYRDQEEVNTIMGSFPAIEEWASEYGVAIDDPDIKRKYERYKESVMEWNSIITTAKEDAVKEGLAEGRTQGLAEGRAQGLAEGAKSERERIASRMREAGIPEGDIAEILRAEG